jgi:O-antigen/teichoic acid export membrane protein
MTEQELSEVTGGRVESTRQIRGSSLLLAGRALSLLLNLVVQVVTVRVLSKEGYGIFAYALSVAAIAEGVIGLGLPRAISRFLPIFDEKDDRPRMLGTIALGIAATLATGAAAMLIIAGLRGVIAGELAKDPTALLALVVLSALAPLQGLDRLFLELFSVFGKPQAIFVRRFLLGPGLRLAAVSLIALRGGGPIELAAGYVVAGVVGLIFYGHMLVSLLRERGLLTREAWSSMDIPAREIFAFAIPLLSTELVFLGIQQADAIMLGQMAGPEQIASLRAVVPFARMNQVVLEIFGILFTPFAARLFARGDHFGVNRLYWSTTTWVAVLSFPLFAVTFMLGRHLAPLLLGEAYADSGVLLSILSFAYYIHAALGPNGLTLNVYRLVRFVVLVNLLSFAIHITANLLLIPRLGAEGAAIATATTLLFHNAMKQFGLRKTGVRVLDPAGVRPLLVVAVGVAALLAFEKLVHPSLPVAAATAAVVTILVFLGTRRALNIETAFPQLLRIPGMSRLLGETGRSS